MPITFYSNPDDIEKRKMRERRDLEKFYRDLAYDPNQPRVPKGSGETGGEWTGKGTKMITVYRGSKSDETVSSGKFSFFTEDIEYAKKYGERLSSKVIDKSKLLDARTDEGKRIIELIRNKKAEQIFLDPNTGAFFYSDLSMIENYLTDLGINKDYEGYVLSEQTLMGTGGISYAIRNSKGFPRDLAYNPNQPRDPKGSKTGGHWTGKNSKNNKVESSTILNEDGSIFMEKTSGVEGYVDYTEEEAKSFKNKTLIHNHPTNSSLSRGDIEFATKYGLKEIRVETDQGIYSLEIPLEYRNDPNWSATQIKIEDADLIRRYEAKTGSLGQLYSEAEYAATKDFDRKLIKGIVKMDDSFKVYDEVWKNFSRYTGWKYSFSPSKYNV